MSESPARHLNLAGASNFRDLGGYPGKDGRPIRWRQIFRSNHLGQLTDADIEVLRSFGLKSAFDFRGAEERATAICCLPISRFTRCRSSRQLLPLCAREAPTASTLSSADALEVMRDSYRSYVRSNTRELPRAVCPSA